MELLVNLFESASSAGSEKAKKLRLISAGFGRYRTHSDGPVTHTIVKGGTCCCCRSGPSNVELKSSGVFA